MFLGFFDDDDDEREREELREGEVGHFLTQCAQLQLTLLQWEDYSDTNNNNKIKLPPHFLYALGLVWYSLILSYYYYYFLKKLFVLINYTIISIIIIITTLA